MTAPKSGNAKAAAAKSGRPSSYRPEFARQTAKLCALGATDADLAEFFGVSEQTLNAWKQAHPEFLEALKAGKADIDAQVERRLFERAMGYSHPAVKILQHEGKPIVVDYVEHYAPDTTACIFWLKNRKPREWRDRQEVGLKTKFGGDLAEILRQRIERLNARTPRPE